AEKAPSVKAAMVEALSKAILEISSSSLTTISGLIALTMMQFRLGYDMGIVLSKGILCSLLTVFFLMPGVIMLFPKQLRRTQHRNMVPNIRPWGVFLTKSKYCFVWLFFLIIPFAVYYSGKTEYAFSDKSITEIVKAPSREAMHKITDTFDDSTPIAVLVPAGYYEKEKNVLSRVANLEKIKDATGLANIQIDEDHVLTDAYTPRMFAELLDLDIERAMLLYQAYGLKHEEYQVFFGNAEEYRVVLLDMFEYLFEKIDQGLVTLTDEQMDQIGPLRTQLKRGTDQLRGENYDRLVFTSTVAEEGEESTKLVEDIRSIAEEYYEPGSVLVIGNITSARDLASSYTGDSEKINLLTVGFIFVILLFTFNTFMGAVVLVFVIQGSIWINFTIPYFMGTVSSFVTNMIVSAIQMGATIDYAIVIMNRYQVLKQTVQKKEAMADAVREGFVTVITSGSILTLAGLLIGTRVSDVYVSHIGLAVGRGAAISVILVLTVLPQIILLFDKLIDKTKFTIRIPEDAAAEQSGSVEDAAAEQSGNGEDAAAEQPGNGEDAAIEQPDGSEV
nr:MMPL family transporter [Lachnospiraceae bacterium]